MKDKIERILQEFIPHSASYCIPGLVTAILELVEKKIINSEQEIVKIIADINMKCHSKDFSASADFMIEEEIAKEIIKYLGSGIREG